MSGSDENSDERGKTTGGRVFMPHSEELRHVEMEVLIPKKMRAKAMVLCADLVKEFEDCVRGRTVSAVWACRPQTNKMKECLTNYYNDKEFYEECKQEYLAERQEFQRTGKTEPIKRSGS